MAIMESDSPCWIANASCFLLAVTYVGSLYLWKTKEDRFKSVHSFYNYLYYFVHQKSPFNCQKEIYKCPCDAIYFTPCSLLYYKHYKP